MNNLNLFGLALGVTVLLAAGVACSGVSAEESQQQSASVAELSRSLDGVQQTIQETQDEVKDLDRRISGLEGSVTNFAKGAVTHVLDRTGGIPDPPSGKVALRLRFPAMPEPLPGEGIQAYETTPDVSTVWAMESLAKGQSLPVGSALKDSTLFLDPGESRTVAVAYKNPEPREVDFLVTPHQESPGNLAQHVWPQCLCFSFVYKAPAEGAWYRVIKVTAGPGIPPGSKVDVAWTVLTDPTVFPKD